VRLAQLANRMPNLAAHKRPIIVVYKTDRRSAHAATELLAAGLQDVVVIRGGTDGQHRRGYALD
jgi:rhodanese-related sulfurtransferase